LIRTPPPIVPEICKISPGFAELIAEFNCDVEVIVTVAANTREEEKKEGKDLSQQ